MRIALALLVCLILSWQLPAGVSAFVDSTDTKTRADQLLKLSKKQPTHDLAILTTQQALALFQSINDQEGIGESYFALGRHYYTLNEMKQSAQNYESALQIWRELHDPGKTASALTYLGYIEGRRGEWRNGFSYLTQALLLSDDQNDLNQKARIAAGMGYFFDQIGMPEDGLIHHQRAKEYFREALETRGYNRQIMLIGSTYLLLGNYASAISNLQEALENFKAPHAENPELDIAECEEYLGQV